MRSLVFPLDSTLPARERRFIGFGIAAAHLLLIAFLLQVAGRGVIGTGHQPQGEGTSLSVTFVTLSPPSRPSPPTTQSPPPIIPDIANGAAPQTTRVEQSAAQVLRTRSETGEHATLQANPQMEQHAVEQTAAASASPAAKGGSPGDDHLANYHAALRAAIRRKWAELSDRPFPKGCALRMTLAVGGAVNASSAKGCALPSENRMQLEATALMAQPLPYAGYEAVFSPELELEL